MNYYAFSDLSKQENIQENYFSNFCEFQPISKGIASNLSNAFRKAEAGI